MAFVPQRAVIEIPDRIRARGSGRTSANGECSRAAPRQNHFRTVRIRHPLDSGGQSDLLAEVRSLASKVVAINSEQDRMRQVRPGDPGVVDPRAMKLVEVGVAERRAESRI